MLGSDHPAPFMTFTFKVADGWQERVPEVVHEDGSSRAQVLQREFNPRYYDLMVELEKLTGNGVVLNTSLNRRGEAMICSPTDALEHVLRLGPRVSGDGRRAGGQGGCCQREPRRHLARPGNLAYFPKPAVACSYVL
jgi:hypothetical protein